MSGEYRERMNTTYDVPAVAVGSFVALVGGQLHEALFTGPTHSRWVACALLHSEGGQHDRRNCRWDEHMRWTVLEENYELPYCSPYWVKAQTYSLQALKGLLSCWTAQAKSEEIMSSMVIC